MLASPPILESFFGIIISQSNSFFDISKAIDIPILIFGLIQELGYLNPTPFPILHTFLPTFLFHVFV